MLFKNKSIFFAKLTITIFLFLMFIYPSSTLLGAKTGLLLWFNTILPTLLPFIIISNLVVTLDITKYICFLFSPIFTKLFNINQVSTYPIIIGLISGIPVGAKTCSDMVKQKKISATEGQFLLLLCSNPSYMFIVSYIASTTLGLKEYRFHFLGILYISSIINAYLFILYYKFQRKIIKSPTPNNSASLPSSFADFSFKMIDDSIVNGFEILTKVGGYMILFSVLGKIISNISSKESYIKLIFVGLMEITTGINYINSSSLDLSKKIILILTITSFGGLSSVAQTKSVIANSRLSLKTYVNTKLLNALLTLIISTFFVNLFF